MKASFVFLFTTALALPLRAQHAIAPRVDDVTTRIQVEVPEGAYEIALPHLLTAPGAPVDDDRDIATHFTINPPPPRLLGQNSAPLGFIRRIPLSR